MVLQVFITTLMDCWNMPIVKCLIAFSTNITVCTLFFRQLKPVTAIYEPEDIILYCRDVSMIYIRSPLCRDVYISFYSFLTITYVCRIKSVSIYLSIYMARYHSFHHSFFHACILNLFLINLSGSARISGARRQMSYL
jgi:hypothetical protein